MRALPFPWCRRIVTVDAGRQDWGMIVNNGEYLAVFGLRQIGIYIINKSKTGPELINLQFVTGSQVYLFEVASPGYAVGQVKISPDVQINSVFCHITRDSDFWPFPAKAVFFPEQS